MFKSEYLNRVYDNLLKKYAHETEFLSAVTEFFDSMDYIVDKDKRIEENAIMERITEPERVISFRCAWVDDNNKIQVNTGYRVQFNSAIGPYKGGTRFDKSVNLSILKFLGFEQTFKNSLTGLPMGGGKGGSDFDPRGKSDNEIMRFCQSYIEELYRHIGPSTDVPAGDLGVGAREIGYMVGMYKKLANAWDGTFTGKGISYGGSLGRSEATGYGIIYYALEALKKFFNTDLKGKKIIISGSGKVGSMTLKKAVSEGAIVVGMSDINGCVKSENGLDTSFILDVLKNKGEFTKEYIEKYKDTTYSSNPRDLWDTACDIAFPCATQKEINLDSAKALVDKGCYMVIEGANMPTEVEAIRYFIEKGLVFAPGKASNAGGVAVSGLEMSQNAMHLSWTFEEVDNKLKEIMKNIFNACYEVSNSFNEPKNLALGANIAGFNKVLDAMLLEGVI